MRHHKQEEHRKSGKQGETTPTPPPKTMKLRDTRFMAQTDTKSETEGTPWAPKRYTQTNKTQEKQK